ETWPLITSLRRRRRRRGYNLASDEEPCSASCSSSEDEGEVGGSKKQLLFSDGGSFCGSDTEDKDDCTTLQGDPSSAIIHVSGAAGEWVQAIWPSLLPQYTERIEVPVDMNVAERVLESFTTYRELKVARTDAEYEKVFMRLQTEWTYIGGL
ncbi:hypothetical protein H0H87_011323, partial [Tephrocybe sp. NHM501043]